jgi:hypothetical protein
MWRARPIVIGCGLVAFPATRAEADDAPTPASLTDAGATCNPLIRV